MMVYRFKPNDRASHRVALTSDATGQNLPADGSPWQSIGEIDLSTTAPWVNAPIAQIHAAVDKVGYFIWSVTVPRIKTRFHT